MKNNFITWYPALPLHRLSVCGCVWLFRQLKLCLVATLEEVMRFYRWNYRVLYLYIFFRCLFSLSKWKIWRKFINTYKWILWGDINICYSNKSQTRCNNFPVYYPDGCLQLNMFRAFSRPSSGAQWLQWQSLVLPSYRGDNRAVFVVGPFITTAVTELLIMGGKTPETCWAVNKRQDNKLKNCCIRLVMSLNCTMMHGHTNLKFYI